MPKFNWDSLPDADSAAPASPLVAKSQAPSAPQSKGAKFDWDSMPDYQEATPQPGMLKQAAKSVVDSLPMLGAVTGGILGTPMDAFSGPLGTTVGAGIGGYLGSATKNLINSYIDPDQAPKTVTQAIAQPVKEGAEQALMSATGEAVAPYIGKAVQAGANATKTAGSKVLSYLGGVRPEVIQEYAQNASRINSAPSVEALKEISDQYVGKLASDVNAKKATLDQATDALKGLQSDLKNSYNLDHYDAKDALMSAKQTLKDAHAGRLEQLSGDVYDTVNQLKSDVVAGSKAAQDVLSKSDAKIDLAPVYSQIDQTVKNLKQTGTDEALSVADKLENYKTRLKDNTGSAIFAPDAKKLIKGLDQSTEYSPMAGAFDNVKNAAFKGIRATLDDTLKGSVPEYAKAMEPVAQDASLLSRVSDFGDKEKAAGLLKNINNPSKMEHYQALSELGQKYDTNFIHGAQPESLPEHQALQDAQSKVDSFRKDLVSDKIEQTVAGSREKAAFDEALSQHNQAQERLAPFKPLAPTAADQTSAQQKLIALGKGKSIELDDMFGRLGKLTDTNFAQAMKDNEIKAAFEKGATNGSRNTLMGALTGFVFGGGIGGAAVGGSVGRVVDQWGPTITKKVLDAALKVADRPSVQAIRSLNLPDPIKQSMIIGLENYFVQQQQRNQKPGVNSPSQ